MSIMMSRRRIVQIIAAATGAAGSLPVLAAFGADAVKMFDTDNDGTLDKRELAGRLSAKELAAADPDRDGTLTLDEYLAVVERRFNAANPDKDGTLDAKELNSRAGKALLRLLK